MVMVQALTNMTQMMNMAFMQWVANNNNNVSILVQVAIEDQNEKTRNGEIIND